MSADTERQAWARVKFLANSRRAAFTKLAEADIALYKYRKGLQVVPENLEKIIKLIDEAICELRD